MKQEKEVLITGRTQEDDERAQKAAAMALETAFLKKKQLELEKSAGEEPAPIPAKRQSVKKAAEVEVEVEAEDVRSRESPVEYKTVGGAGGGTGPAICLTDFASSGTDYSRLARAGTV